MLIAVWPLVVVIAGALIYGLSSNSKMTEIGKWMFIVGLFWLVYSLTGKTFHLGK